MPTRGRPGYDRATVVAVCVGVFNKHGYEATSMSMLADALGLSKAAIYHHVRSKEQLLAEALECALGGLEAVVRRCQALDGSPGVRLHALLHDTITLLVAEAASVTLLLRLRGNTEGEQRAMDRRRQITRDVQAMVADAQASGEVRSDMSARLLSRLVLGQINSVAEWYQPDGSTPPDVVVAHVNRIVSDSLRPPAGAG